MFGKTNSVAASGGGDVVEAVNNMGTAVKVGDKVWLNRHIFDSVVQTEAGGAITSHTYAFNLNNKFYWHLASTLKRADFKNNAWRFTEFSNVPDVAVRSMQFRGAQVWENESNRRSVVFREMGNFTEVAGIVVSEDMAVISDKICTYDTLTGAVVTTGGAVNASGSTINAAFLFGNILFVGCENKKYYFYDITDINAPVLLKEGAFIGGEMVVYATGLAVGNYLIARNSIYANERSNDILHIYKIVEGYALETAPDLPKGLDDVVGLQSQVSYNNNTGVLCVGVGAKLTFYQFFDGVFHQLDIKLSTLPSLKGGYSYLVRLNDDMSIMALWSAYGSRPNYNMWFFRLSVFNEQWYAEPYADSSATSFTGFAAGEAENGAAVTVQTVFPKILTLTLEVENDEAMINVKGVK